MPINQFEEDVILLKAAVPRMEGKLDTALKEIPKLVTRVTVLESEHISCAKEQNGKHKQVRTLVFSLFGIFALVLAIVGAISRLP